MGNEHGQRYKASVSDGCRATSILSLLPFHFWKSLPNRPMFQLSEVQKDIANRMSDKSMT